MTRLQVEIIHAYVEPGALYRYVPVYFSDYMTELLRAMGVQERPYHMVLQICEPVDKKHNHLNLVLQVRRPGMNRSIHVFDIFFRALKRLSWTAIM